MIRFYKYLYLITLTALSWFLFACTAPQQTHFHEFHPITQITTGTDHALLLDNRGIVWASGNNAKGQLGVSSAEQLQFTAVFSNATAVFAGGDSSAVINQSGTLLVAGNNESGQLGLGDVPFQIGWQSVSINQVVDVAFGEAFSLILTADHQLWGSGSNENWELGLPTNNIYTEWTPIPTPAQFTKICAGSWHSLAIDTDGNLWGTGWSGEGQVGTQAYNDNFYVVGWTKMDSISTVTDISAGIYHSLALKADGTVWGTGAWGGSNIGQLGLPNDNIEVWTQLPVSPAVSEIEAGAKHSFAITTQDIPYTTGDNYQGALGLGHYSITRTWTATPQFKAIKIAASLGNGFSLALTRDGTVWGTGNNNHGQLGLGHRNEQNGWVLIND